MKFKPSKYLILMEEEWLTFGTIDTLYDWAYGYTVLVGTEIELCFMTTSEVLTDYMFIRNIDTTGKVLSFCERILWGE